MINQIISHQKSILFLNFANIKGCTAYTHCVLQRNLHGLLPHTKSSDSGRNLIGRRTESDWTANGIRLDGERYPAGGAAVSAAPTKQTDTFARLMHFLLGWCAYCSVGALETSAPPKRRQHLCRSEICGTTSQARVSSVGATGRGCSCLSCTNKADRHVLSVGALLAWLVHFLLGWCT